MAIDLLAVAEAALGRPVVDATVTARTSIAYDPYLPGRSVERVSGLAVPRDRGTGVGDPASGRVAWSAVVKRTADVDLRAARRELAAYRDGVAGAPPTGGLAAPALLGSHATADHVELWLEALVDDHGGVWPAVRFGVAAEHIAAWDVHAAGTALPADFDSEDAWAERHGQPHRLHEGLAELDGFRRAGGADEAMAALGDPGFRRTEALVSSTPARIERLAAFRQGPLHHDLVRSNLFATGPRRTAAIDWENVGRGPLGVDLAPLVIGSVRRGEAPGDGLAELEALVLDRYIEALGRAGVDAATDVRAAYRLAIGLRWHVVLGTIGSLLDPTAWRLRGSRPDEPRAEALTHLVPLARHILATAEAD